MQKKITSFLIFVVIILNMCAVPVFAGTAPSVSAGSATGKKGDIVEIPVVLKNNTGFACLGIEISYNPDVMKLKNVVNNPSVGGAFAPAQKLTANPYNMSWNSAGNIIFNGTLATLTFEIITDKNGTYPITIDYYKGREGNYVDGENINYDENFDPLNLTYTDGKIEINVENSITLNDDLSVSLHGDIGTGIIFAALYGNNNQMKQVKISAPSETFKLMFDSPKKGDKVKVMWWDNDDLPVCESKSITLP